MFVDTATASILESTYAYRSAQYTLAIGRLQPETHAAAEQMEAGWLLYGGPQAPVNRAVGLGFAGPVDAGVLDRVEDFYRQRGCTARVDLCPLADSSLRELLRQRGYRLDTFYSMLAFPLQEVEPSVPRPQGVRVTEAGPEQEGLWLDVVARGFAGAEEAPPSMVEVIRPTFHSQGARLYLAWRGDEAVGGGALLPYGLSAECGSASTLLQARKHGIHTALLYARLEHARQAGCRYLSVVTVPAAASQRNVQRFGFQLAYTRAVMVREDGYA